MSNESDRVKSVFLAAVEDYTPDQWDEYLEQECQDEPDVCRQVKVLLQAHIGADSLLDQPAETVDQPIMIERAGTIIGPYKLLEVIGEGGMGVVYMAEQTRPVERRVALKIIKPGMDSKQVIARFEAERTALAMMDHPNIATVLDAGTTESGRPYFVMELVKGIPITKYCAQQHLTPRQRLTLFVAVCHAVQHAHQKGIIHRDLKPANVLVAHYDHEPVPKVIDFGVAKATGKRLTDNTYFTGFDQVVGTLEYMSPEQVRFNQRDIDTRSDIYSLGVILYELLTGDTPFEPKRLRSAAIEELVRIIREEEPLKPSTRLSSSSSAPSMTFENCGTEPHKLLKLLRGDLDWLIMKALDKERDRRYETANGMAADIERYLAGDPIEARPPSTVYRLGKFARRHTAILATSALILVSLLASTGILWSAVIKVEAARVDAANGWDAAKATLKSLHDLLIERAILCAVTDDKGTEAAIQLAKDAGVSKATLLTIQGIHLYHSGNNLAAIARLREALSEDSENVLATAMLVIAYVDNGKWCDASSTLSGDQRFKEDTDDTGYEALFRGYALRHFDRRRSERILQRVVDDHPTWAFARTMLGCVKADIATRWEDDYRVNEALGETRLAYEIIGDNRVAQAYMYALTVAIHCAKVAGEPFDELRQEADKIALLLKNKYPEFRGSNGERGFYYVVVGEMDAAEEAWEAASGGEDGGGLTFHYAALLVRLGRQKDAVDVLNKIELKTPLAMQAKACFVLGTPGGREKARLLCEDVIQKNSESKHAKLYALQMLCLLGDLDRVRKESKDFAKECANDDFHKWINTWFDFFAEPERLEMFKEQCDDCPERRLQFHYNAAFYFLAIHDKDKAKHHFEQCIKEGVVDGWTYWAMAYVKLLEDNPNWPYEGDSQASEPVQTELP